jgi:hypothetical protein
MILLNFITLFIAIISPLFIWDIIKVKRENKRIRAINIELRASKGRLTKELVKCGELIELEQRNGDKLRKELRERDYDMPINIPNTTSHTAYCNPPHIKSTHDKLIYCKTPFSDIDKRCECGNVMKKNKVWYVCPECKRRIKVE